MTSSPHIARVDDDSVPAIRHATRLNFEYLVATLSKRTRDKKYENFVINYIWNILGDPTLKPVTQQYVNRRVRNHGLGLVNFDLENAGEEDADHALIDLYFPSLRLGVECDEASHFDRRDNDERRTADIERAIVGYEEHRVQVEKDENGNAVSPDAVLAQIDDVVARIRQRKAEVEAGKYEWAQRGFSAWESDQVDWRLALREGCSERATASCTRTTGRLGSCLAAGTALALAGVHSPGTSIRRSPGTSFGSRRSRSGAKMGSIVPRTRAVTSTGSSCVTRC